MEKRDLLLQVAHMYYGLGLTQEKIAKRLFFSRSRISHLLTEAEQCGVVTFELRQQMPQNHFLQDYLRQQYHLQSVFVEDCSFFTESECYSCICKTAAEYLSSQLTNETVLSISRGHTAYGIVQSLKHGSPLPGMCVVQTEGMLLTQDPYLDQMDFVRKLADLYGCRYEHLMLPYLFDTPELKQTVVAQPFTQTQFARQKTINLVCSSISSLQQWRRYIQDEEYDWLVAHGAVGSIQGNFYDIHGTFLHPPLEARCVIPDVSVLEQAAQLICVCIGSYKSKALLGILRTGLVTTLVTNVQLAQQVRQLGLDAAQP